MLTHLAVVPTTPLILPGIPGTPPAPMADLAEASRRAVQGAADADVVILLAGGGTSTVIDAPGTDLAGYGLTDLAPHVLTGAPPDVVAALRSALGTGSRVAGDAGREGDAAPDLAVLARQLPAGAACVGITVPADTDVATAEALADTLLNLGEIYRISVVAAGDLGAGHGTKPPRPAAAAASDALQQTAFAALDNGRLSDLVHLDAAVAADSAARSVGALRVLAAVALRARVGMVVRAAAAPLGVGYVIAQGG
ncbi:hypothetical protein BH23ACT9_BH23ACT9_31360 [soil metagenome]